MTESPLLRPRQSPEAGVSHEPIRRSVLGVQVRDAIEDLIVFGAFAPGERLAEISVADRLGVSRQPVREALQSLASVGFVDLTPGKGAVVHVPTLREVRETFHVRALLEADACALAALTIGDAGLAELEELCGQGEDACPSGNVRLLLDLDARFHATITQIAGNHIAADLIGRLQRRVAWYMTVVVLERADAEWAEHRAIVAALADSDADSTHRLMLQHIHHSLDAIEAQRS